MKSVYDYIVVGGGIVGVSTAWQLQQRHPECSILLVEKESGFAKHQTGHNSGVIHAGVYYAPGSLKADFCKRGVEKNALVLLSAQYSGRKLRQVVGCN